MSSPDATDRAGRLPVQLRHGARLVGRWATEDHQVVAVWQYTSIEDYNRIQSAVTADPDSARAQAHRATLGPLFTTMHETFMTSALPASPTPAAEAAALPSR